jgi:hypothetical protein
VCKINKVKVFENELSFIQDEKIKNFASKCIELLPDYFFEVAASSTGKYHPTYALNEGGLIRHTKAAVLIANELLNLEMYNKFTATDRDLIITALILHDGFKHGNPKQDFTVSEHPLIAANWIKFQCADLSIPSEQCEILVSAIRSHMGQFCKDYKTKEEILPKPKTALEKFVHQADYLASRKFLEVNFGDNYYKPEETKQEEVKTEDNLAEVISSILTLFKSKIDSGFDKETIYKIIAENNDNRKNPNSITDIRKAHLIYNCLMELK